jgi:hypothetical protein
VFWWFERNGSYMRCEAVNAPDGGYELRIHQPDGTERIERFRDSAELTDRQRAVEAELMADGWSGPHGWNV